MLNANSAECPSLPKNKQTTNVYILTSARGLGPYIAAVLLASSLREAGLSASVELLEDNYNDAELRRLEADIQKYQANFRIAELAARVRAVWSSKRIQLSDNARRAGRLIVLTGEWCSSIPTDLASSTDLVYLDRESAPSWEQARESVTRLVCCGASEVQLTFASGGRRLTLTRRPSKSLEWQYRQRRFVLHAGGWGLGDLQAAVEVLVATCARPIELLLGSREPYSNLPANVRQYRISSCWQPWVANEEAPFPPLYRVGEMAEQVFTGLEHSALQLVANAHAIVAKPGGMTLAESLMTATPVLFLPPFGEHERANAEEWVENGFGMYLTDWTSIPEGVDHLYRMHMNLVDARVARSWHWEGCCTP